MYDYLPWQLMQPAATTALVMEFLRWLTVWLSGVSLMAFVVYLLGVALLTRSEARKDQRARSIRIRRSSSTRFANDWPGSQLNV